MNLKRDTINRLRWLRSALLIPPLEEESLDKFSERVVREALRQSADEIAIWVNDILAERQNSQDVKILLLEIRNKLEKLSMNIAEAIQTLSDKGVVLDDISAKLTEGFTEITNLIGQLQNTTLTPEQETIVNALSSKVDGLQPQAQSIADIVPNP